MSSAVYCLFAKEFWSYFRTRLGYFVLIIYTALSMTAAFYSGGYFDLVNDNLFSLFYFQPEIFTLLAPALTMRLWADERRYGTLEMLLSQPVNYLSLVIGKFLAAWAFCALMLVLTVPLWLTTATLQPLDHLHIVFCYLACLLAAGALCAVGCTVSAFNNNPVSAYVISVFICWLLKLSSFDYVIRAAKISNELVIRISNSINFDQHYQNILNGQLSPVNLVYFISIIFFALWINTAAVEYKRS